MRSLAEQRLDMLARNRSLLTPEAIERSRQQACRNLRPDRFETPMLTAMRRAAASQRTLVVAIPYFVMGGAERLLSQVVGSLARAGWRVIVFSTEYEGEDQGRFDRMVRGACQRNLRFATLPRAGRLA